MWVGWHTTKYSCFQATEQDVISLSQVVVTLDYSICVGVSIYMIQKELLRIFP